jgi:hypothetical protein
MFTEDFVKLKHDWTVHYFIDHVCDDGQVRDWWFTYTLFESSFPMTVTNLYVTIST